jgi:hypothetical protein
MTPDYAKEVDVMRARLKRAMGDFHRGIFPSTLPRRRRTH